MYIFGNSVHACLFVPSSCVFLADYVAVFIYLLLWIPCLYIIVEPREIVKHFRNRSQWKPDYLSIRQSLIFKMLRIQRMADLLVFTFSDFD